MKKTILIPIFMILNLSYLDAINTELQNSSTLTISSNVLDISTIIEDDFDSDFEDDFDEEFETETDFDPLSYFNRIITDFNIFIYDYTLLPATNAYDYVLPDFVKDSFGNFFQNLKFPLSVTSNLLQLEFMDAFTETSRFVINSTIGVVGLFDPATSYFDIEKKDEDLGQTFGTYGIGPIFHIVLPFIGPTNLRDLTGDVINWTYNPFSYVNGRGYNILSNGYQSAGIFVLDKIETNRNYLSSYQELKNTNNELYIEFKSYYEQHRNALIKE